MTMNVWKNPNDGFEGIEIGTYRTLEGEQGLVLQMFNKKIVHVYRAKWLQFVGQYLPVGPTVDE